MTNPTESLITVAREVLAKIAAKPGTNFVPGTVLAYDTATGVAQLHMDGDPAGNIVHSKSIAGALAAGNRVLVAYYPPRGIVVLGVIGGTIGAPVDLGDCAARAYQTSGPAQTIPPSAWTKVVLDGESFDADNNFDSTTNSRYTCPVDGNYQVNGSIMFTVASVGSSVWTQRIAVFKNGTQYTAGDTIEVDTSTSSVESGHVTIAVSDIVHGSIGDYLELFTYHDLGTSAIPVFGHSGPEATYFSVAKL